MLITQVFLFQNEIVTNGMSEVNDKKNPNQKKNNVFFCRCS